MDLLAAAGVFRALERSWIEGSHNTDRPMTPIVRIKLQNPYPVISASNVISEFVPLSPEKLTNAQKAKFGP